MTLEGLRSWAQSLLRECEKKCVHCIAVTDHHDLLPGILALAVSRDMASQVWVFPGMEVTSSCGIQGILLLDPRLFGNDGPIDLSATEAMANLVLGTLGQDIAARADGTRVLKLSSWKQLAGLDALPEGERRKVFVAPRADRVDREFDGEEGIAHNLERICKDKYVLLPNLEKNKQGVFGNENGRKLCHTAGSWFVGGIVGGGNPTDENAIRGKNFQNYGDRVLACIRTSDQRGQDEAVWFGDRFGTPECVSWLKLSEHTTTSITQALISGEGRRIFRSKPNEPTDQIETIEISGAEVFGLAPIKMPFSPNLSTLVGGRGSGKSLVISALVRLFHGDADWLEKKADDLTPWEARHLSLFAVGGPFYGPDVALAVEYTKDSGVRYRLSLDTPSEPLVAHARLEMWSGNTWAMIAEGDAVKHAVDFHPLFFLQGQMSAMTGSYSDQVDLIKLIEGPIRETRRTIRENLAALALVVREGYEQKRQRLAHEERLAQLQAQSKQKEGERKGFLDAAKKGLSNEQQRLFSEAEVLRKGKGGAQRAADSISQLAASLRNAETDLQGGALANVESVTKLLTYSSGQFSKEPYLLRLQDVLKRLGKGISDLRKEAERELQALDERRPALFGVLDRLIANANEIGEREKNRREALRKAGIAEKEVEELEKQVKVCEQEIQAIQRSGKIEAADKALAQFREVVTAYSWQFMERAQQISANGEFRLLVKVIPGGLFQSFLAEMKRTCQGCGVREKTWTDFEEQLNASDNPASERVNFSV